MPATKRKNYNHACPDLVENSFDGVECTAHYPGSGGAADITSDTIAPVVYKSP